MWDNPRRLNIIAGALVGVALLAFCLVGLRLALRSTLFPMLEVDLTQRPQKTSREEIERALSGRLAGNFFSVDLAEARAALEALPWVRSVEVRRVWPGRLQVSLEEQVALARWGDDALVNVQGERFSATTGAALPSFIAPHGTEGELTRRYARFSALVAPLGARIDRIVLTPRLAWEVRLASGLHIMLGRDAEAAEERLRRFVEAYDATLQKLARKHDYVDLRYPNGFALRVPELDQAKGG